MKPWLRLSYRFYRKLTSKRDKPAPVCEDFHLLWCVNYGTKTLGSFEERSYNRHYNAYCQRKRNRHFLSVNEQSTAGVVSYNCTCISKVKSPIRGLAVGDLGMTLGASQGGTSIHEALKKRINTLQYLVT